MCIDDCGVYGLLVLSFVVVCWIVLARVNSWFWFFGGVVLLVGVVGFVGVGAAEVVALRVCF